MVKLPDLSLLWTAPKLVFITPQTLKSHKNPPVNRLPCHHPSLLSSILRSCLRLYCRRRCRLGPCSHRSNDPVEVEEAKEPEVVPEVESELAAIETQEPVVEESELSVSSNEKAEELAPEDSPATKVLSSEAPASILEQGPAPEPTPVPQLLKTMATHPGEETTEDESVIQNAFDGGYSGCVSSDYPFLTSL